MKYGMKTSDIIEQVPFNLSPQGPHKNLVRQITDELGIEVKRKRVNNKDVHYIDDLPTAMNPEATRAARVLIHDVSNHQYNGSINRGLEYHPSVLNRPGAVPVSEVDAAGDWIHLASLVELIKGVRQYAINDMPFYLRGLVRMVTLDHLHHILLYAALTDLKTNIQIGVDDSAYIWVRAVQFHGALHEHHNSKNELTPFHLDGTLYKDKPIITALFRYAEAMEAFATQDPDAYKNESAENFLMPLDRYPNAYPTGETDQVLALRIKVQTAQQLGMITLPSANGLIITSGVPIKSVVGALDHHGRILDVLTLPTLEWKVADSPREQFPCGRGICYLPSLEVFHTYRLETENTGEVHTLLNLPVYDPSKKRSLRAQRAPDSSGVHEEMLYCEFKGCSIMVYGKIGKQPIGTNRFPGWETIARPARFDPNKGKGRARVLLSRVGARQGASQGLPQERVKVRARSLTETKRSQGKTSPLNQTQRDPMWCRKIGRIGTMRIFQLYKRNIGSSI